jgi:hypothetical protein
MRNKALVLSVQLMLAAGTVTACAPAPPPGVVYVARRPPADRVEVIGARPAPGHVWLRGYWRWDHDDFVWVPGHWALVEHGYREWVPGRWHHGRRGWYYIDGHWR